MKILLFFLILITIYLEILCIDEKQDKNNDNKLFEQLRNLISLIDQLRDCGINEYIELPRICTLGTQSSGKSSVLETIVGLDFLPRGNGIVTRRPLELRLYHTELNESWAKFEERNKTKFTDFAKVKQTIEELTSEVCGEDKNIVDKPIILSVYCRTCPDLTLIDLPGITRVPVGAQPDNIEEITRSMATKYINNSLTIILCVIAANNDIATSDGLKLAKEIDKEGIRTLGVLTKLDLMDEGTDAKKTLLNEEIKLKLGYVGLINRSKKDLDNKLSMEEIFKKEKTFFRSHPIYKNMYPNYFGKEILINKLTNIYFDIITKNLPKIIKSINNNIKIFENELDELGPPIPQDKPGKIIMMLSMSNEYCEMLRNILQGKLNKNLDFLKDEGGFKIRKLYEKLLKKYTSGYNFISKYSDEEINDIINKHEGHSIPGFPNLNAFLDLIEPQFKKLKKPIEECFENVFQYLTFLSRKILDKVFNNFPKELNYMNEIINNYLNNQRNKTKYLIDSVFNMETSYIFTNDKEYLHYFDNKWQASEASKMKDRVAAYFKLIVRNLRDSIPKIIGNYLVKDVEDNIQKELYFLIRNLNDTDGILIESKSIIERRKDLKKKIEIMKNAQNIIKNNPYFINSLNLN